MFPFFFFFVLSFAASLFFFIVPPCNHFFLFPIQELNSIRNIYPLRNASSFLIFSFMCGAPLFLCSIPNNKTFHVCRSSTIHLVKRGRWPLSLGFYPAKRANKCTVNQSPRCSHALLLKWRLIFPTSQRRYNVVCCAAACAFVRTRILRQFFFFLPSLFLAAENIGIIAAKS